jgi:DDB1- and CUL4-associated factor 13
MASQRAYSLIFQNPWSAPFTHKRFSDVIKFKLWNTTERFDNIEELREKWRDLPFLNSGGYKYEAPSKKKLRKAEKDKVRAKALEEALLQEEGVVSVSIDLVEGVGKFELKEEQPVKIPVQDKTVDLQQVRISLLQLICAL